jgi:FkbM family methyltransferase
MASGGYWRGLFNRFAPRNNSAAGETVSQQSMTGLLHRIQQLESHLIRRSVYIGDHECLTKLTSGHKIYVDTRDVSIASHLMIDGHWEPWVARVLMPLVKPGMKVCDIGANFGYYTLLMAQAVGAEGHVWAVEANPRMTYLLRKSLSVNGLTPRTTLLEVAAWDSETEIDFVVTDSMSGGGRVRERASNKPDQLRVPARPLDKLIKGPLDVIKIDVEGAEERALTGLARAIEASPQLSIVTEFYAPAFGDPLGFLTRLAAQGFTARVIRPEGLGPELQPSEMIEALGKTLGYVLLTR